MMQTDLDVSSQKLSTLPESVDASPWLVAINASRNRISRLTPFVGFSNLKLLNLGQNCLGALLKKQGYAFEGLDNLQCLILKHNKITHLNEHLFSRCTQLRHLDISNNELSHSFRALTQLSKLQILNLQANKIDNICHFKPLRGKLPRLLCIMFQDNPMENKYQCNFEGLIQNDYFPSVRYVMTKYCRVNKAEIVSLMRTIDGQSITTIHDLLSSNSEESEQKMQRSISTNLLQQQQQFEQQRPRSVTPTPLPSLPQSAIKEESLEYSQNNLMSPSENFCQDILSPNVAQRRYQSSDKRSRDSNSKSVEKRIQRYQNQGTLQLEVDRQGKMLGYLQRELEKVERATQNELRQKAELNLINEGFQACFKATLCLENESRHLQMNQAMTQLSDFSQTIDVFTHERIQELIFELLRPLFDDEYLDIDRQLSGMAEILQKMQRCMEKL